MRAAPRRGPPEVMGEVSNGSIVRLDAGLVRVTAFRSGLERRCILLGEDLRETPKTIWVSDRTRVPEVLRDQGWYEGRSRGGETDPLKRPAP